MQRRGSLIDLLRLGETHRWLTVAALAASLLAAAAALAVPWLGRAVIDRGVHGPGTAGIVGALFVPAVAWFAASALRLARNLLAQRLAQSAVLDLRRRLIAHALALPMAWFDHARIGDLTAQIAAEGEPLRRFVAEDVVCAVGDLAMVIGGAALLTAMEWRLTAALAAIALAAPLAHRLLGPRLRALHRATLSAAGAAMARVGEALASARVVKSFGREAHEARLAGRQLDAAHDAAVRAGDFEALVWSGAALGFGLVGLVVLGYGALAVAAGRLSPGTLLDYAYTLSIVGLTLASLAGIVGRLQRARAAADRLGEILEQPVETDDEPAGMRELTVTAGAIDFDDVGFGYRPGSAVLDRFSLHVEAGRTTALVGATGAGKSTAVSLLMRFYEPACGCIRIDGVSIASVTRRSLRGAIAVVPQQALLFDGSIADNIRYGRLDASDEEVRRVAVCAHVAEFADRLPGGMGAPAGERGVKLSAGQAQRIAIARALLRDAPILLLDEATSALDPSADALVHDALRTLMSGRTTLVIAHRLATVERADQVALLDRGRVAALGTHAELRGSSRRYVELFLPVPVGDAAGPAASLADSAIAPHSSG